MSATKQVKKKREKRKMYARGKKKSQAESCLKTFKKGIVSPNFFQRKMV